MGADAHRCPKRAPNPLELELQVTGPTDVGAGNQMQISGRAATTLNY